MFARSPEYVHDISKHQFRVHGGGLIKKAKNHKPSGFETPRAAYKFRQKPKTAARNRKPHSKMDINRMPPGYNPPPFRLCSSILISFQAFTAFDLMLLVPYSTVFVLKFTSWFNLSSLVLPEVDTNKILSSRRGVGKFLFIQS